MEPSYEVVVAVAATRADAALTSQGRRLESVQMLGRRLDLHRQGVQVMVDDYLRDEAERSGTPPP